MSFVDLSLVTFEIDHEGCWSKITSDYPVIVRTIFAKSSKGKDYILGFDEIKARDSQSFKNFLRAFRKEKSVYEVIQLWELDKRRNIYRILFKERYNNMIMGIVEKYMIFYIRDLIKDGHEKLLIVLPSDEVEFLKSELESLGKIYCFKVRNIDINVLLPEFFVLSEQERKSITTAIKLGYYEYPRKINLEELAKTMKLSKPTLEEYIRKAEKKIMARLFNELYYQDLLLNNECSLV